jgi:hypothetical protein
MEHVQLLCPSLYEMYDAIVVLEIVDPAYFGVNIQVDPETKQLQNGGLKTAAAVKATVAAKNRGEPSQASCCLQLPSSACAPLEQRAPPAVLPWPAPQPHSLAADEP